MRVRMRSSPRRRPRTRASWTSRRRVRRSKRQKPSGWRSTCSSSLASSSQCRGQRCWTTRCCPRSGSRRRRRTIFG
eukprot:13496995-Heterocapsa_arctica.AAC.1